ncbi:MAG: putative baseplate assembly protein [Acidobacteriota bacterium]
MAESITLNQYYCGVERRRNLVHATVDAGGNPVINGIDFLEVSPADQKTLLVHFIHNVPGETGGVPAAPILTSENFAIDGGVRVTGVLVTGPVTAANNVLTIKVDKAGDFSSYTLRLITSPAISEPPPGFDRLLSELTFSFKINCESDFDCSTDTNCPPNPGATPYINYLAKDYSSFRRLILDRLAVTMPDWRERNPADLGIALVELLAYTGDYLSYYQDAVATEAYLATARRRTSVRRHARLVDYPIFDGANARTWLVFETDADRGNALLPAIPKSTMVIASASDRFDPSRPAEDAVVFETMHDVVELRVSRNAIPFYTWGDSNCCLPKGATRASLEANAASHALKQGEFLVFEEVLGAESGLEPDADRSHRHVVRLLRDAVERIDPLNGVTVLEIQWRSDDALPFPLCLNEFDDGAGGLKRVTVARANVALADHGRSFINARDLLPTLVDSGMPYRPVLKKSALTHALAYNAGPLNSASTLTKLDARRATPAITLRGDGDTWHPRRDLLASDRFAPEFVVEMEEDGRAYLRFGDGTLGRKPQSGSEFIVSYRVGNGTAGNVGAEALNQLATDVAGVKVRNPLPATGGMDPEAMRQAKLFAPVAFRSQERAVTEADYVAAAERHPGVQRAAATRRWTGSWYTMFITVDRRGGAPVDAEFEAEMRAFLGRFRMAGYDLEIDAPRYVPLDVVMTVCAKAGHLLAHVKQALLEAFSNRALPDGSKGFFHPDNFTFGQPVYLSQLIARAMRVTGVESVNIDDTPPRPNCFRRWGQKAQGEIAKGFVPIHRLEIARVESDRSTPENGRIDFILRGGS